MTSTYRIEPHAAWAPGSKEKDVVVATSDSEALREARLRCAAGALFRYTHKLGNGAFGEVYVAPFFEWERR